MATIKELREMSSEQMTAVMDEARQNLFRLRVQAQTDRLDVPSELKRNRRLIARIKTLQTESRMAAGSE
jgi:large subunit ribosomal protein L29